MTSDCMPCDRAKPERRKHRLPMEAVVHRACCRLPPWTTSVSAVAAGRRSALREKQQPAYAASRYCWTTRASLGGTYRAADRKTAPSAADRTRPLSRELPPLGRAEDAGNLRLVARSKVGAS
jgi:hypothetical protein